MSLARCARCSRPAETAGSADRARDAGSEVIPESWSHIEVATLPAGKASAIAADLEHALGDVRLAVEDYPKMRAMALRIADELARELRADEHRARPGHDRRRPAV